MNDYLLICRSITYAQRASRALQRAGITNGIIRIPVGVMRSGCGYAVRVRQDDLRRALYAVAQEHMRPEAVYASDGGGYYEVPYDLS